MVIDYFIFKNNRITLLTYFTFMPKIGMGLPETGIIFTFFDFSGANFFSQQNSVFQHIFFFKERKARVGLLAAFNVNTPPSDC